MKVYELTIKTDIGQVELWIATDHTIFAALNSELIKSAKKLNIPDDDRSVDIIIP